MPCHQKPTPLHIATLSLFLCVNFVGQLVLFISMGAGLLHAMRFELYTEDWPFYLHYSVTLLLLIGLLSYLVLSALYRCFNLKFSHWLAALLQAVVLFCLFVEIKQYTQFGIHLISPLTIHELGHADFNRDLGLSPFLIAMLVLAVSALTVGERLLLWVLERQLALSTFAWIIPWMRTLRKRVLIYLPLSCVVFVAIETQYDFSQSFLAAMPVWGGVSGWLTEQKVALPNIAAYRSLPDLKLQKKPNLLFIVVESLRYDMWNATNMPRAFAYFQQRGCVTSAEHYANGHVTQESIFALLYGLNAYHYEAFISSSLPSHYLAMLKANGYRLAWHGASPLQYYLNWSFMAQQFDEYHDYTGMEPEDDKMVLNMGIRAASAKEPNLQLLFFGASHYTYAYPDSFAKFQPVSADTNTAMLLTHASGDGPQKYDNIFNRYKNSVLYVDSLIGDLLATYTEEYVRHNLVIVLIGDHGEEFGEHGGFGHVATRFYNERNRTPFVMCFPDAQQTRVPLSSHVDIMPTFFRWAMAGDAPTESDASGIGQPFGDGISLWSARSPTDAVIVSGASFPQSSRDIDLIDPEVKYWLTIGNHARNQVEQCQVSDSDDHPLKAPLKPCSAIGDEFFKRYYRFLK